MSINRNNTSETPKKAALYVRVSTNYQIDRDSLPMQRQELITYARMPEPPEEKDMQYKVHL